MEEAVMVGLGIHSGIGLLVALAFQFLGGPRKVPGFRGSGILFRLLILPSMILLWPLLVGAWLLRPTLPSPEPHDGKAS